MSELTFGTDTPDAKTFDQRKGRCYELAAKAVAFGAPAGSMLVHGTIQGFGHPPLDHAWVKLPDGSVWEPILMRALTAAGWESFFSGKPETYFDQETVLVNILVHENWGPW